MSGNIQQAARSGQRAADSDRQADAYIPATDAAELLELHESNIRRRCYAGEWAHRYIAADSGGRRLEVAISSLPAEVRAQAIGRAQAAAHSGDRVASEYELASPADRAEADRRLGVLTEWRTVTQAAPLTLEDSLPRPTRSLPRPTRSLPHQRGEGQEGGKDGKTRITLDFVRTWRAAHPGERVSKSSLYAWDADYRAKGIDGVLPGRGSGRDATVSKDSPDGKLFLSLWSGEARFKVAPAYRAFVVVRKYRKFAGTPPTLSAIRYMLGQLRAEEKDALRLGDAAYAAAHLPFMERDYRVDPLEWFCMDDRQFDITTISRMTGKPHRPYVCAGEDLGTRRAVVTVVERPCQDGTLSTAGKALSTWGVFTNLYVDNGKNYKAKSVTGHYSKPFTRGLKEYRCRSLCDQLGITPHFAIKFNARAKPVERLFNTISENLDKIFSTYCGRSPEHKPEDLKERLDPGRIPTDDEFERALTGWIESEYHAAMAHDGEGMDGKTPNQAWADRIGSVQVRWATREQLKFWGLRAPQTRGHWPMVRNGRIIVFGRRYHAAMENIDCLHGWEGREVIVRVNPQDVRYLFVTDLEDRPIGWIIEKGLLGFGEVSGSRVDEARARQRRAGALKRAHRQLLQEEGNEPDALKRTLREHYASQARTDEAGRPVPTPPPGIPKVHEIIPMSEGARASARMLATPPQADRRLHLARAQAADEVEDEILLPRRERVAALRPSRADLSDAVLEEQYALSRRQ